jgi:hypothetical protein
MRLCEKQKASKAVRAELVKALIHNRQSAFTDRSGKQRFHLFAAYQKLSVAVGEITDVVLPKFQSRVHSHLHGIKRLRTYPGTETASFHAARSTSNLLRQDHAE